MTISSTPFVTSVRATAFVARGRQRGVNLSYFNQDGAPVANAFSTLEDVEAHAHDLLAVVATARNLEGNVRFGAQPNARSTLMKDLVLGERQQASATIHDGPPEGVPYSLLARLLAGQPGAGA